MAAAHGLLKVLTVGKHIWRTGSDTYHNRPGKQGCADYQVAEPLFIDMDIELHDIQHANEHEHIICHLGMRISHGSKYHCQRYAQGIFLTENKQESGQND